MSPLARDGGHRGPPDWIVGLPSTRVHSLALRHPNDAIGRGRASRDIPLDLARAGAGDRRARSDGWLKPANAWVPDSPDTRAPDDGLADVATR